LEDALARIRQFRAQYGNEQNPVKKSELGVTIAMEQIDVAKVELELAEKEGNPTRIIDKRVDLEKAVLELQEAKLELQEAKLELDKVEWQEKTATNHANLEKAKTHDDQSFWNTRWLESLKNEDVTQVQLADCRSALATFSAQIPLKVEAKRRELLDAANAARVSPIILTFEEFNDLISKIPMVPETSTDNPEAQARLLGYFNLPEYQWPLVRRGDFWRIDLEFLPSLLAEDQEIRPAANAIMENIEQDIPCHLLLAVSGSGKTSAFADLAKSYFVIYIQCTSPLEKQDLRKSRGFDAGFAQMLSNLALGTDVQENARKAEQAFCIELTCRIAQLYRLYQIKPDVTPLEFYIHQRMVGDEWLESLRSGVKNLSEDACRRFVKDMRIGMEPLLRKFKTKLVLAVDEIEVAATYRVNHFDEDKSKQKAFLSPMLQAVSSLETAAKYALILTGTGSSLERVETIKSGLNKPSSLSTYEMKIPEMFPHVTLEACKRIFSHLNVKDVLNASELFDDVEFDPIWDIERNISIEDMLNYAVIGSRFRTLTRILDNIAMVPAKVEANQGLKKAVLRDAVRQSILGLQTDLVAKFESEGGAREGELLKRSHRFNDLLVQLWTGLHLNGSEMTILSSGLDLMQLGVGNYTKEKGMYSVTERIVTTAIERYLQSYPDRLATSSFQQARDAFARLLASQGNIPAKGNLLENLVFTALLKKEFQGKVVGELPFVKPFVPPKGDAAEKKWWETSLFFANHVASRHSMTSETTTPSFLASEKSIGVVFSPETVARFDACLKLDATHAMVFAVTIWSSTVPNAKVESQILSTDMRLAYYTKDGKKVNSRCRTQQTEWKKLGLTKVRAIRVHIALPVFAKNGIDSVPIADPDEFGVHLDENSISLLLGDNAELGTLLAIATKSASNDQNI